VEADDSNQPAGLPGRLVIATRPSGARVLVDGKDTGRTTPIPPSRPLSLPSGKHRLELRAGPKKVTQKVHVRPGKTLRVVEKIQ
jgi:hypothetical protein